MDQLRLVIAQTSFAVSYFFVIAGVFAYLLLETFISGGQEIQNLNAPQDADGNLCGVGNLKEYPSIYFVTPIKSYLTRTVCVKVCPTNVQNPSQYELECYPNSLVTSCKYKHSPQDLNESVMIYNTTQLGNTICEPLNSKKARTVSSAILVGEFEGDMTNIQLALPIVFAAAIITFFLAFIFTCLLTYLTTIITWVFLVVYILFTGLTASVLSMLYFYQPINFFQSDQSSPLTPIYLWVILALDICFIILLIRALYTVTWKFKNIKFMISIIKISTRFIVSNKSVILIPLVFFVMVMSVFALWLLSSFYLLSHQSARFGNETHFEPFQRLVPTPMVVAKLILNFIGLLWLRLFLLNFAHFLTASTSALWYMKANKHKLAKKSGRNMLWKTLKIGLRYHTGSIAAGSLFLLFIEPISSLLNSTFNSLQKYRGRTDNMALHYIAKCFFCCCCACQGWVMYINKQTYTEVYLLSESFFESTKSAHFTMRRNRDFELLSGLGDDFTHFSKMFFFLITTMGCILYMLSVSPYNVIIYRPIYPALFIGFISLSTAQLFMDVFGQSGDSILLTYFTDLEVENYHFGHDGSETCPDEIKESVLHLRQKQKRLQR